MAYWFISTIDKRGDVTFMNYGYFEENKNLLLSAENEKNRYAIQLYHEVASTVDIKEKDILEIGCGRGGGLNYITTHLHPASATGIDLNEKAIAFCQHYYSHPAIRFFKSNAEKLELKDTAFDIVFNIESSHGYPHIDKFLAEVQRVLKPGGYFLFADFRPKSELQSLKKSISDANLFILNERLITDNVVAALDLIHTDRDLQINQLVPSLFRNMSRQFAALQGTPMYTNFKEREFEYFLYVIKK